MTSPVGYLELTKLLARLRQRFPNAAIPGLESVADMRAVVARALSELPERWRAIVLRCDLTGELHATVAVDLGISKRHLYRERRKALQSLCEVLGTAALSPPTSCNATDRHIAVTAVVNPLLDTQRAGQAVAVLENALGHVQDTALRVRLLLKLSQVHCQLRALQPAADALRFARHGLVDSGLDADTRQALQLEYATEEANLLRYDHQIGGAKRCLRHAIRRNAGCGLAGPHANYAFADAHLALANLLGTLDEYAAALGHASEAERLLRTDQLDVVMRSRLMTHLACFRFLGGMASSQAVLPDIQNAYSYAQLNGRALDALQAVTVLSLLHSHADCHAGAVRYGEAAVAITHMVGMRHEFATGAFYTLGSAQAAAGDFKQAAQTLREAAHSQSRHPQSVFPFALVLQSRLMLAAKRHREALHSANEAIRQFQTSGQTRWLGTALQLRASIEDALGERAKARNSVDDAITLLEQGAPFGALSEAHSLAADLTGERGHGQAAVALAKQAEVNAPAGDSWWRQGDSKT